MPLSRLRATASGVVSPYRQLLDAPDRRAFVLAAWLGRFPKSSLGLATILMVALLSSSYALAGAVSAVFVFALAVGGPQWSRAMDRFGQARVLRAAALSLATFAGLLLAAIVDGWPIWMWFVFAALCGLSIVDMGSVVRAKWTALLPPERRLPAFALETINDELVFVISPPVVTVLAALIHPALGFVVGLAAGVTGYLLFSLRSGTLPVSGTARHARARGFPLRIGGVVLAFLGLGGVFGSFDVATVALAQEAAAPAATGLIIGVFALASTLSGVVLGSRPQRGSTVRRFVVAATVFAIVVPGLLFSSTLWMAALFAAAAGVVTSPLMITGLTLVETRADLARLTETLAYPTAGLAIGGTFGALLSGVILDTSPAQRGYLVTAGAALVAGAGAILWEWALRRLSSTRTRS